MSDSPAVHAPLDPKEAPILARVLGLRDQLSLLKQDRSSYIKSHDVIALYDQVIEQVHLLNTIREEHGKALESNRGPLSRDRMQDSPATNSIYHSRYRLGGLFPVDLSVLFDYWPQQ